MSGRSARRRRAPSVLFVPPPPPPSPSRDHRTGPPPVRTLNALEREIRENSAKAFDLKLHLYYLEQRQRELHGDGDDGGSDDESCLISDGGDGDSVLTEPTTFSCPGGREGPVETVARLRSQLAAARDEVERRDAVLVEVSSAIVEARDRKNEAEETVQATVREHAQQIEEMARLHEREVKEKEALVDQECQQLLTEKDDEYLQLLQEKDQELQEVQAQRDALESSVLEWRAKHEAAVVAEGAAQTQLARMTLARDDQYRENAERTLPGDEQRRRRNEKEAAMVVEDILGKHGAAVVAEDISGEVCSIASETSFDFEEEIASAEDHARVAFQLEVDLMEVQRLQIEIRREGPPAEVPDAAPPEDGGGDGDGPASARLKAELLVMEGAGADRPVPRGTACGEGERRGAEGLYGSWLEVRQKELRGLGVEQLRILHASLRREIQRHLVETWTE